MDGPLPDCIRDCLQTNAPTSNRKALEMVLEAFEAQTATLHRVGEQPELLNFVEAVNVPDSVLPLIQSIPFGKGMAGQCAAQQAPVSICNLQQDESGTARPGARATGLEGTLVVPITDGQQRSIGTLGIGKREAYTFSEEETALAEACAATFGEHWLKDA